MEYAEKIIINNDNDRTSFCLPLKWLIGSLFAISVILSFTLHGIVYYIEEKVDKNLVKNADSVDAKKIIKKNSELKKTLSFLLPNSNYIVIDTAKNILYLKRGNKVIHQATVSTGSGSFLIDPKNKERRWVFDTPRGEFAIKKKIVGPSWVKPDWAFIEEGEDIPKNYYDRFEEGVLGDYALEIGNGYFIHGTLYTRLLGKSVTHGCIRLGDNDLKTVYKATRIGTKVYIF